jgi:uncharacterized protein
VRGGCDNLTAMPTGGLFSHAGLAGNYDAVAKYCSAGMDVNAPVGREGRSLLHYACRYGNLDIAKLLVENGAFVDAVDADGRTPLLLAAAYWQEECVWFLIQARSSLEIKCRGGNTIVHYLAAMGFLKAIQYIVSIEPSKEFGIKNIDGATPLHFAAQHGRTTICRYFLQRASHLRCNDLTAKDRSGNTPLNLACANNHEKCALFLLAEIRKSIPSKQALSLSPNFHAKSPRNQSSFMKKFTEALSSPSESCKKRG